MLCSGYMHYVNINAGQGLKNVIAELIAWLICVDCFGENWKVD